MSRISRSLAGLAIVAGRQNQMERALRLGTAAGRLAPPAGTEILPSEQEELDRALMSARESLGEEATATLVAEGQAMTLEQVIADALEGDEN
jgi:hypothetical protein